MKRKILLAMSVATSLFATSDDNVLKYVKMKVPPYVRVTVEDKTTMNGYEVRSIKFEDGVNSQSHIFFTKDNFLYEDVVNLNDMTSMRDTVNAQKMAKFLTVLYQKEKAENIIAIGNNKTKETLVLFSDPECPYCAAELSIIEDKLKDVNLKIILTPVHEKTSLQRAYKIYEETKNLQDDTEKIKIMKKYYNPDESSHETVSDDAVKKMDALRKGYLNAGLRGVPFYINEKDLIDNKDKK